MHTACLITDEAGTWPGTVLSWIKQPDGWHAVVRYRRPHGSGHVLNYERWVSAFDVGAPLRLLLVRARVRRPGGDRRTRTV